MEEAAPTMVQQIEQLLNDASPTLAHLENTLTAGYARALALEAEKLRIERRLGEVARGAAPEEDELRRLGTSLRHADGEIERLRTVLGTLYDRARDVRAASASN